MTLMENLGLTQPQRQAIAKTMLDLNYSATKIAEILGINRTTVYRYSAQPTEMEMQHFATEIKQLIFLKQQIIIAQLLRQIEKQLPDEWDVKSLAILMRALSQ